MNKNDFPNENEWKKIVEDAFSSDEEHIFSEHYKLNKARPSTSASMVRWRALALPTRINIGRHI